MNKVCFVCYLILVFCIFLIINNVEHICLSYWLFICLFCEMSIQILPIKFFLLFKWIVWATYSVSTVHAILPREHTGHSKHPHPTTKEMAITRWSTLKSDGLHSLQPKMDLYTLSKNKTRSWLWLRSWTPYCKIQTEIEESRENH